MNQSSPAPRETAARWTADDIADQSGRTFLITGANSGLGYETSRQLARHGGTVIMTARDPDRGEQARSALRAEQPDARLELRHLNLADLDSVRRLAAELTAAGRPIDVLINNAGIMMPPRTLTPQGNESQFGVNHLGHFTLTGLLLDLLRRGRDARVVTVSSSAHRLGRIRFDDLTGARKYGPMGYYAQSKLANTLFGLELDRRLTAADLPIRSVLTHPGYVATPLQTKGPNPVITAFMRLRSKLSAQPR